MTLPVDPAILVSGSNTIRIDTPGDDWGLARVQLTLYGETVHGARQREVAIPSTFSGNPPGYEGQGTFTHLYLPSGYTGTSPVPLVIALHDQGKHREDSIKDFQAAAEARGWLLAAPELHGRTLYCESGCDAAALRRNYTDPGDHPFGAPASQQDVLDVLAYLQAHYAVDAERVYLIGHGMAGPTALLTASKWPHLFAGVVAEGSASNMIYWEYELRPPPDGWNSNATLLAQMRLEIGEGWPPYGRSCE